MNYNMNRDADTVAKENLMATTDDIPNVAKSPPLFQGDIVCFHEIFEWLSLEDIQSVGQTCKRLQTIAADFFKCFLSATVLEPEIQRHSRKMSNGWRSYKRFSRSYMGFHSYAQEIEINEENDAIFRHIASTECGQVRRINFGKYTRITRDGMLCIKGILNNIKVIELNCKVKGELYSCLLQFCPNLEHLIVHDVTSIESHRIIGNDNRWFARKYPKLTHFEVHPTVSTKMSEPEVKTFFKLNPQIKILGFNYVSLTFIGSEFLLKSKIQLDVLSIEIDYIDDDEQKDEAIDFINGLYDQGFYKRLHVCGEYYEYIAAFPGCEGYTISHYLPFKSGSSLTHLKYLNIDGYNVSSVELLNYVRIWPNIERLNLNYSYTSGFSIAVPFLQHCAKLKKMRITNPCSGSKFKFKFKFPRESPKDVIDLFTWDRKRAKLAGAQKVTIFLEEADFLTTKWSNKTINLEFVEVRRAESYEWNKYIH